MNWLKSRLVQFVKPSCNRSSFRVVRPRLTLQRRRFSFALHVGSFLHQTQGRYSVAPCNPLTSGSGRFPDPVTRTAAVGKTESPELWAAWEDGELCELLFL